MYIEIKCKIFVVLQYEQSRLKQSSCLFQDKLLNKFKFYINIYLTPLPSDWCSCFKLMGYWVRISTRKPYTLTCLFSSCPPGQMPESIKSQVEAISFYILPRSLVTDSPYHSIVFFFSTSATTHCGFVFCSPLAGL